MNAIAREFADHKVGSIFLYTHEAHPGEHYPPLRAMADKYKHAAALRDVYNVTRPIFLDALEGPCHRTYGGMPNMTWIFNRSGHPIYKSDWTDANSVRSAIEDFLDVARRRKGSEGNDRERLTPFNVERLDYRTLNQDGFFAGLERNGPRAVTEFRDAI